MRHELKVCGLVLGTFKSWDEYDSLVYGHYGFIAIIPGLPDGNLTVNFETGVIEQHNDDGETTFSTTFLELIKATP